MSGPQGMGGIGGHPGMRGPAPGMRGPPGMMMGGPTRMDGPPGVDGPVMVEPNGPIGPKALMENYMKPDDVTFKEFYCTICKKQTDNEDAFEAHKKTEEHVIN